jgi:hypothetical protein
MAGKTMTVLLKHVVAHKVTPALPKHVMERRIKSFPQTGNSTQVDIRNAQAGKNLPVSAANRDERSGFPEAILQRGSEGNCRNGGQIDEVVGEKDGGRSRRRRHL